MSDAIVQAVAFALANPSVGKPEWFTRAALGQDMTPLAEAAVAAARPLIESEAKARATDEYAAILTLQSDLLEATVNVLRGDPPELTRWWSHHDVVERTQRLKSEREALAATVARVEALFAGGPDTSCRTTWRLASEWREIECVEVPMDDLRAALADPAPDRPDDHHDQEATP